MNNFQKSAIYFFNIFLLSVTLFFFVKTTSKTFHYTQLKLKKPCSVEKILIERSSNGTFFLTAFFSFTADEEIFQGKTALSGPNFLNHSTAFKAAKELKEKKWEVWHHATRPQKASLEKKFPTKDFFYFLCSLCIFLYFLIFQLKIRKNY